MSITQFHPRINPDTLLFLAQTKIPDSLQSAIPWMVQLPVHLHWIIMEAAAMARLGAPGIAAAFRAAVEFQNQDRWRCAACFAWFDSPNLPLCTVTNQGIIFVALCAQCERRYKTDEALRRAIAGYVGEEAS